MRRRELPSCYSIEALVITEEEGAVALPLTVWEVCQSEIFVYTRGILEEDR